MPPNLLFVPMAWERRALLHGLGSARKESILGFPAWRICAEPGELVLLQSGVGPEASRRAALAAAEAGIWGAWVLVGCGGSLRRSVAAGCIVLADSITDATAKLPTDRGLTNRLRAELGRSPILTAGHVTVAEPVLASGAKATLAGASGAAIVEMEAAPIAEIAAEQCTPFGAVRVVLDEAESGPDRVFDGAEACEWGLRAVGRALREIF